MNTRPEGTAPEPEDAADLAAAAESLAEIVGGGELLRDDDVWAVLGMSDTELHVAAAVAARAVAECPDPAHTRAGLVCAGCNRAAEAELTRLRDRYQRMLNSQGDDRRRTYAAARRSAQDEVRGLIGRRYLAMFTETLLGSVRPVLWRASQLDPAQGRNAAVRQKLTGLRDAAVAALAEWDEHAGKATAASAGSLPADPRERELSRLRGVIIARAQLLHSEVSIPPGEVCHCHGCELLRDMDSAGLGPRVESGPVTVPDGRRGTVIGGPDAAASVMVRWDDDGSISQVLSWALTQAGETPEARP